MKKLFFLGLSVAALMAFDMKIGKNYSCESVGISFADGNQTRNIPVTPKTKPMLEKTLKMFFNINATKIDKNSVKVKVGKIEEVFNKKGKWKGYDQYLNKDGSAVFMPDKNETSNNAALILPAEKLVIFYKCK